MTNKRLQALKSRIEEMLEVEGKATPGPWRFSPNNWNCACAGDPNDHAAHSIGSIMAGEWYLFAIENGPGEEYNKDLVTLARNSFRPMLEGWLGVIRAVESCRETDLAGDEEESQESCYHCDPYLKLLAALADQLEVK